ncbi:MAG TPA: acyl-CoA dehydrogenase family protein [Acidimicrobiales bacterium]|nr:acyl-CoA dehydrogenase family protein [Acidimicrobiales bacterium]
MDFSFTEEQETVRELAARILGDLSTPERLKEVASGAERVDRRLWKELGSSGLLSVALPESIGGAGLGFVAAGIVAEEVGRVAAAVPFAASVVWAGMPIARFGTEEQCRRWLGAGHGPGSSGGSGGLGSGELILSAALSEPGGDPFAPAVTARRDGDNWRLEGTKSYVPAAEVADALLITARTEGDGAGGVGLFLLERGAHGVSLSAQEATDWRIEGELELAGAAVGPEGVLCTGAEATEALVWTVERAQAVTCLEISGACQAALKLTAEYTTQRHQFDKPIATFQAVGQRAADAYIDTEAVRLTAWQAAWRLAEELGASKEVAIAKFWADEGGQRVVHAAQHLHGGVGVDRDYPLHRYFLLVKHLALTLGGTTPSLLRLGDILATEPA